jgi:RNA polymerase sigma-70 factor (ECF subfamily)
LPTQLRYDEKELLSQVAGGDEAAYKILFTRYWDQIYSTALMFTKSPDLSEDLAQDVFAKIWEKRQNLSGVDKLEGYLFITARNLIFDRMRKKVLTAENDEYLQEYFSDPAASPQEKYEMKEMNAIIQKGISQLPAQQQTAFRLSRFGGLSHEEIAAEMGIAKQTVKSHIGRAIISLRKTLEAHSDKLLILIWIFIFL